MGMQHVQRDRTDTYKVLLGKPEEKISLGSPTCRRADDIKMDLNGTG